MADQIDRSREARLRRAAHRCGLALRKSRSRSGITLDDHGGYRIIDLYRNWVVAGERFNLSLDDVEAWLAEDES